MENVGDVGEGIQLWLHDLYMQQAAIFFVTMNGIFSEGEEIPQSKMADTLIKAKPRKVASQPPQVAGRPCELSTSAAHQVMQKRPLSDGGKVSGRNVRQNQPNP